jgi:hypothetical protein
MTEERKLTILIVATILSARKLAELEHPDKPSPKKIATVETAIRSAASFWKRSTGSGRPNLAIENHARLRMSSINPNRSPPAASSTIVDGSGVSAGASLIVSVPLLAGV